PVVSVILSNETADEAVFASLKVLTSLRELVLRNGGEMRLIGHGIRTSCSLGQRPRRVHHGCATAARCFVGTGRALAPAAQAPPLPSPRPQAAHQPPSPDRHLVRAENGYPLERPAT